MSGVAKNLLRLITHIAVLAVWISVASASAQADAGPIRHEPVVRELIGLLEKRTDLQQALSIAVENANLKGIQSVDEFFGYLDELLTWIPTEREIAPKALKLYYIVNQAPEDLLNMDEQFNVWMKQFVQAFGDFLDTPASAKGIESFASSPSYKIDDYFVGPSGWLTFNQFFAREIRPGKRPIAANSR